MRNRRRIPLGSPRHWRAALRRLRGAPGIGTLVPGATAARAGARSFMVLEPKSARDSMTWAPNCAPTSFRIGLISNPAILLTMRPAACTCISAPGPCSRSHGDLAAPGPGYFQPVLGLAVALLLANPPISLIPCSRTDSGAKFTPCSQALYQPWLPCGGTDFRAIG